MTREENLHWIDEEIRTWENECQSKHPVKEALYAARKALKQEPTLEKDGTLIVTTEHYKNVGRVLVQCGTNGALFYQDQEPTTKNDIRDNRVKNELNRVKDELEPTTKNNRGVDCSLDDFIKYCKRTFGVELTVKKSDNPDTYAKLFGTTKNNLDVDAVSRKDVHDMLENLPITVEDKWFNWLQKACMRLAELPSVTPQEPRKGHWVTRPHVFGVAYCSECGFELRIDNTNFCPNCGADMREGEE